MKIDKNNILLQYSLKQKKKEVNKKMENKKTTGVKRNLKSNIVVIAILGVIIATGMSGCLDGNSNKTLTLTGSTTVLPIAQDAADAYMAAHSDVDIQISAGGSSVGIKSIGEGTVDIGMASREMKDSEKSQYPNLVPVAIALDGIAIIVNPENNISGLTKEQVKDIYLGQYSNWNELGGPDMEIVIVGRDTASGTRGSFDELVLDKEDPTSSMLQKDSNGAVHDTVKTTPGAIGYVGLGYVDSDVKGVAVNGITPTQAHVQDGTYPISRSLWMITQGERTGLAKEFIDYILSPAGQEIVDREGFVKLASS